jgi:ATP-binding cassette, subfamily B, bacterial MsbA
LNPVHVYLRILRWVRPYLPQVVASVVFTIIFSLVSSTSIVMMQPFLKTLFAEKSPVEAVAGAAPSVADPLSLLETPAGLKEHLAKLKTGAEAFLMGGTRAEALWRIVWVIFILFLIKNVTQYFGAILMSFVGQRVIKDMRDAIFDAFTRLPLSFYHRHRAGELISRATNDVLIAQKSVNVSFTNLVRDPLLIIAYLSVCVAISWKLTFLAFMILPLSMGAIVHIGKRLRRYSHRQQERMASLTSVLQETVYGIRVVKAFAMEEFERRKFLAESERLFREVWKIDRMQRLSSPISEQLSVVVALFILWFGGREVLAAGEITPSYFITFLFCLFSMVQPIKELSQVNNAIQEGTAAAERLFSILDDQPEADDPTLPHLPPVRGRVEFQNVNFTYATGEPVLCDIDLVVEPGEVVALVGSSGAGKSTLVDLIPRFYDPQEGRILIDGHDIRGVSLASLRRAMGIVTQEVILFNDTVRNNIAYGLADVDQGAVEAAARAANAHEFIAQMPQGYDTVIGDRGTMLSGGQRQRLSIARAILKNPPILILDEATSALDTESEQLVQEAIDRLVKDRTTFVVAHRLSTIRNADRIYALRAGRVVESGGHQELLARGGVYAELYNLQFHVQGA